MAPSSQELGPPANPGRFRLTLEDWNCRWVRVPGGLTTSHRALGSKVGLFRLSLDGQIMVVGTGTDKSDGLAKRFSDYRRAGDSSRRHYAGQLVHEHLDRLELEVLITGSDWQARETARKLKGPMIGFLQPLWTVSNAPFTTKSVGSGSAKQTL